MGKTLWGRLSTFIPEQSWKRFLTITTIKSPERVPVKKAFVTVQTVTRPIKKIN
jgi:hypothetical protein